MDSVALPAIVMTEAREEIGSDILERGSPPVHTNWEKTDFRIFEDSRIFFDSKSSNHIYYIIKYSKMLNI